jgi:uncharacterized protein (DUF2336 family)
MLAGYALVSGLDDVVRHGGPDKRAEMVRRISELFVQGAARFGADHVELFDGVLSRLLPEAGSDVRGELAARLAPLGNAPPGLIGQLVRDEDIGVSGALLRRSPMLDEATLVEIARMRGQTHLMAITERPKLSPPVTDVIVRRGDREVVRKIAGNAGAEFSPTGYGGLIRRAAQDGVLALAVVKRDDLSAPLLKDLLLGSADIVRRRLFEVASPRSKIAINRVINEMTGLPTPPAVKRDFAPAQRAIVALHHGGGLSEAALLGFARGHQYEEAVAALSAMCGVRIATIDGLIMGERHDPILILGKALGVGWTTVRALIGLRLGPERMPAAPDLEEARLNFERLAAATAQRVLGFWRTRSET